MYNNLGFLGVVMRERVFMWIRSRYLESHILIYDSLWDALDVVRMVYSMRTHIQWHLSWYRESAVAMLWPAAE